MLIEFRLVGYFMKTICKLFLFLFVALLLPKMILADIDSTSSYHIKIEGENIDHKFSDELGPVELSITQKLEEHFKESFIQIENMSDKISKMRE